MTLVTAVNVSQFNYNGRYTNGLTVQWDWLECNTTGQQSKFNLITKLENFVVSCQKMQQTTVRDFFNHADPELTASYAGKNFKAVEAEIEAEVKVTTLITIVMIILMLVNNLMLHRFASREYGDWYFV